LPSTILRACVSVLVRRRKSAWALPRPSATASAKFAKTTVNHSQSEIAMSKPASLPPRMTDVAHEEEQRHDKRADFDDEHDRIARLPARIELDERIGRRAREDRAVEQRAPADGARGDGTVSSENVFPCCMTSCSTIGPSASAGKKVSAPTMTITPIKQHDEDRRVGRERADRFGTLFLPAAPARAAAG
jgi:hypothetical protein